MRIPILLLSLALLAWPRDAWATWHITACGESMESNLCFPTYDDCAADLPNWYAVTPAGCTAVCEPYYGACGADAVVSTADTTSWNDLPGRYGTRQGRYPYGRTMVTGEVASVGVGLGLTSGAGARISGRPAAITVRATRRVSIGGFVGFFPPSAFGTSERPIPGEEPGEEIAIGTAGGHLRISLWASASRNRRNHRELYLDLGGGVAWMADPDWTGKGNASSAALGVYVMSHYAIGIGLSTGVTYANIRGATHGGTGEVSDVGGLFWNALTLHIVAGV